MDEKIVAIIVIGILGLISAYLSQNGYIIAACVAAIAGLAGVKPKA